ncbi:MAG: hypothetical protein IH590_18510 [Aquamicrobium sp.]|nr:hypothetical protein [Aquamicrobium sp.]
MASPSRPAAGGSYVRRSRDDEPVLVSRTVTDPAELPAPIFVGIDLGREEPATDAPDAGEDTPDKPARQGKRRGR